MCFQGTVTGGRQRPLFRFRTRLSGRRFHCSEDLGSLRDDGSMSCPISPAMQRLILARAVMETQRSRWMCLMRAEIHLRVGTIV